MDVRSAQHTAPVVEHNGTVPVWWLVSPHELYDLTRGGFLELVSEWEVAGGGKVGCTPAHLPRAEPSVRVDSLAPCERVSAGRLGQSPGGGG